MTAILKVDTIQDTSGNNIINESSDTITIGASGDTTNIIGTLQNNGSALSSNPITMADQWRVTANITSNTDPISANLERIDTAGQGTIGTAMSVSSGRFTFPLTGTYLVSFASHGTANGSGDNIGIQIQVTPDNSSYSAVAQGFCGNEGGHALQVICQSLVYVPNTSTHKVSFRALSIDSGSYLHGDTTGTSMNQTYMTFIRLGDA